MLIDLSTIEKLKDSNIYLCNGKKERIGIIRASERIGNFELNGISQISLKVYKKFNEDFYYEYIDGARVYIDNLGWWIMTTPTVAVEDVERMDITLHSAEFELTHRKLNNFVINLGTTTSIDNVVFYNPNDTSKSLLHLALNKFPDWSIGEVDAGLYTKERSFEIDSMDVYSFLTSEVSKTLHCIFVFDIENLTVSAYRIEPNEDDNYDGFGINTDIYVSNRTIIESLNKAGTNDDNISTAVRVYGRDGINIRDCNCGQEYLYNLSFYRENMSDDLQYALDAWEALMYEPNYYYNSLSLQDKRGRTQSTLEYYDIDFSYLCISYCQPDDVNMYVSRLVVQGWNSLNVKYQSAAFVFITPDDVTDLKYDFSWFTSSMDYDNGTITNPSGGHTSLRADMFEDVVVNDITYHVYICKCGHMEFDISEYTYIQEWDPVGHEFLIQTSYSYDAYDHIGILLRQIVDAVVYDNYSSSSGVTKNTDKSGTDFLATGEDITPNLDSMQYWYKRYYLQYANLQETMADLKNALPDVTYDSDSIITEITDYSVYGIDELENFLIINNTTLENYVELGYNSPSSPFYSEYISYRNKTNVITGVLNSKKLAYEGLRQNLASSIYNLTCVASMTSIENNFPDDLGKELTFYTKEGDYTDETFVITSYNTSAQGQIKRQNLMNSAQEALVAISQPQYEITADIISIMKIPEFKPLYEKFQLGNFINVYLNDTFFVKERLISISDVDFDDPSSYNIKFSNNTKSSDGLSDLDNLIGNTTGVNSSSYSLNNTTSSSSSSGSSDYVTKEELRLSLANLSNSTTNQISSTSLPEGDNVGF